MNARTPAALVVAPPWVRNKQAVEQKNALAECACACQQRSDVALEVSRGNPVHVGHCFEIIARVPGKLAVISSRAMRIDPPPLAQHTNAAVCGLLMHRARCRIAKPVCCYASELQRFKVAP